MATLALGFIGSLFPSLALGGVNIAVGTIVGGIAGAFIDTTFLFPALFGTSRNVHGPRLEDLKLTSASEGSPVNRAFGTDHPIAGTVIWLPPVIEKTTSQSAGGGKGFGGGSVTTFTYFANVAIGVCVGPIEKITKIWADGKLIFDIDRPAGEEFDGTIKSLTIYGGNGEIWPNTTATQEADPLIEANEGPGTVPPFRGIAYVLLEEMELTTYGNRLPQFRFLLREKTAKTVAQTIIDIITDTKYFTAANVDVTAIADLPEMKGYSYAGPVRTDRALEPLMLANDLEVRESGEKLVFMKRKNILPLQSVTGLNQLAAHVQGEDPPSPFKLVDIPGYDLPSEVVVNFIEPAANYQPGSQRERRINWVTRSVQELNIPIVMHADQARDIAKLRLWRPWNERQTAEFLLPPSFLTLEETDAITVLYEGQAYTVRAVEVQRGANYIFTVKGVVVGTSIDVSSLAEDPSIPPDQLYVPPDVVLVIVNIGPLRDEDAEIPGYYMAVAATDPTLLWGGAGVFISTDNIEFQLLTSFPSESFVGTTLTVLGNATPYVWDLVNTLDVEMLQGELESRTEAEVLNGHNRLIVGNEMIAFQDAVLIGENPTTEAKRYRISKLIRGLRNTEEYMGTHTVGQYCILLSTTNLGFSTINYAAIGSTKYFKPVATGNDAEDITSQSKILTGQTVIPFSPSQVKGARDSSNNLTITWSRRTRALIRLFVQSPAPDFEPPEFEIDVFSGANVVATYSEITEEQFVYTAAQQTADGLTPGNPVHIKLYQISPQVGRGKPADETV